MLNTLTSRGGLAASTALVAVAFVAFTPMGDTLMDTGTPRLRARTQEATVPTRAIVFQSDDMTTPLPAAPRQGDEFGGGSEWRPGEPVRQHPSHRCDARSQHCAC